ncbi:MAG: ABC transporter ATP-binding protein [Rhodospirillales bacterium]|nr:ABC transporter ATP-binding protein [Rhodospirillales bacterium]MBO6785454.1 ABC transporter ATP-binding protein [Rhodospirillales bacterium]
MSTVLAADGISKSFGGLKAVDSVSFELAKGDIAALIGPNGAGKTTCFNLLGGALAADGGQMRLGPTDITGWPPHRRARAGIGRTFQIAATFRSMTALENAETALMAADAAPENASNLLDDVGIGALADTPVTALAYGDVKRVELAMVLASNPSLLLLDEPTAGMASNERLRIMELVTGLVRARGITVLFTEHDMDTVFGFATRILAMDQGQLIADGTPEAVRADRRVQQIYLGETESGDA